MNLLNPKRISPHLNKADALWNHGEGFPFDEGGALSRSVNPVTAARIHELKAWGPAGAQRPWFNYIGRLKYENPQPPPNQDEIEASFEIVVPGPNLEQGRENIVLVLSTPGTFGPATEAGQPYGPHNYPGDPANYGLWAPGVQTWPAADALVLRAENPPTGYSKPPFTLVGAYIIPRTSYRPHFHALQRLRHLRQAVIILLNQYYRPSGPPLDIVTAVAGSSFGGLVTQCALVMHPDEFQAGVSYAYSASVRSIVTDQASYTFFSSLLGFGGSGAGYDLRNAVDSTIYCYQEETDYESLSVVNRMRLGQMQRPMLYYCGDEDPVTHGTDWTLPLGDGPLPPPPVLIPATGVKTVTNSPPSFDVCWIRVSKACHSGDIGGEPWYLPKAYGGGPQGPFDHRGTGLIEPAYFTAWEAHGQRGIPRLPIGGSPSLPRKTNGIGPGLTTLDSQDHALSRKASPRVGAGGTLLVENTTFQRRGQGTWLGIDESMKVKPTGPTASRCSVFVGSAEGIVTRFEATTVGPTPLRPFTVAATSNLGGSRYSGGYGAWALDVGDVDAGGDYEAVAGLYRRIVKMNAVTLQVLASADLPSGIDYSRPRRLQIVDVLPSAGSEIVFCTEGGHIVVMDSNLQIQIDIAEPGVQDFVIGPVPALRAPSPILSKPIYVLSTRGHVLAIDYGNGGSGPQPYLIAASELQYGGGPWDLEVVPYGGSDHILAMYCPQPGNAKSLRILDRNNLTVLTQFANVPTPELPPDPDGSSPYVNVPLASNNTQPEVAVLGGIAPRFVTLWSDHVGICDLGDVFLGYKHVWQFAPARGVTCVQVGDVVPEVAGEEIILATLAGHVVWLTVAELTATTTPVTALPNPVRQVQNLAGAVWDDRTNLTLSATWAMTIAPGRAARPRNLQAITQAGTWWDVDWTTGTPSFVKDVGLLQTRSMFELGMDSNQGFVHVSPDPPANGTWWQWIKGTATADAVLGSRPYVKAYPPDTWDLVTASPSNPPQLHDGPWPTLSLAHPIAARAGEHYWIQTRGADLAFDGTTARLAFWCEHFLYPNLVSRFQYDTGGSAPAGQLLWNSTGKEESSGVRPPFATPPRKISLRSETAFAAIANMQAVRVGKVDPDLAVPPHVVGSGLGGRAILLDGQSGAFRCESDDYGLGGVALETADLNGDGVEEILFAPLYPNLGPNMAPPQGRLFLLRFEKNPDRLTLLATFSLAVGGDILGYGVCGIAAAELDPQTAGLEVIVTTLNGEFIVFDQSGGALTLTHRFSTIVDGSLGAFNSIHVADLDGNGKAEVYLPSSSGIMKFHVP